MRDNARATEMFAFRLSCAIADGLERDRPAVVHEADTGPLMPFRAPVAIEDRPPRPARSARTQPAPQERRNAMREAIYDAMLRRGASARPRPAQGRFGILDLGDGDCRYPVSEGSSHLFCGAEALEARSYCADHDRLCRQLRPWE